MLKKILGSVISFILCAVIALVACYFAVPDFNAWVKGVVSSGKDTGGEDNGGEDNNDNSGENYFDSADLDFADGESNGIQLMSAKLPFEAYALYSIDTSKVSYQLTATISPATAENKAVDWSVKWVDSSKTEMFTIISLLSLHMTVH